MEEGGLGDDVFAVDIGAYLACRAVPCTNSGRDARSHIFAIAYARQFPFHAMRAWVSRIHKAIKSHIDTHSPDDTAPFRARPTEPEPHEAKSHVRLGLRQDPPGSLRLETAQAKLRLRWESRNVVAEALVAVGTHPFLPQHCEPKLGSIRISSASPVGKLRTPLSLVPMVGYVRTCQSQFWECPLTRDVGHVCRPCCCQESSRLTL